MSNDKLPVVHTTDMTSEDHQRIQRFVERGSPGFNLADEQLVSRLMDLYLSGKTYSQIARIHRVPKELVMLYSQRLNWYAMKLEYLNELELHLKGRVINAKVSSQDFLLQLSQMYQKKIGAKIERYYQTNDETEADKINLKEIDKYLKIVESLHKISSDPVAPKPAQPAVGLNLGDGVTITKTGDNSVEITPKQKILGNMLDKLANERRETELAQAKAKSSDIKEVTPNKEGEKIDEKE